MRQREVVRYGRRATALGRLPFLSYADLPSEVDLRTAYCISHHLPQVPHLRSAQYLPRR